MKNMASMSEDTGISDEKGKYKKKQIKPRMKNKISEMKSSLSASLMSDCNSRKVRKISTQWD